MASAKDLIIKPISSKDANAIIRKLHYSHKVVMNSQIHFGVFLDGQCGGALQFGKGIAHTHLMNLVSGSKYWDYLELNRLALADWLPKNGESRAISICFRFIKQQYPYIKWVISYADATQCGDGLIYRATGFILTDIRKNDGLYLLPDSEQLKKHVDFNSNDVRWLSLIKYVNYSRVMHTLFLGGGVRDSKDGKNIKNLYREFSGGKQRTSEFFKYLGGYPLEGYQLRYIYFLDPSWRSRLTVPEIPYSKIDELGIGMYKGKKRPPKQTGLDDQSMTGGAEPTRPLQ